MVANTQMFHLQGTRQASMLLTPCSPVTLGNLQIMKKKNFKPTKKPQPHFCIQRGLCFKSESPGSKGLWGLVKKSSLLFLPQQILILNFTLWVFTPFPVSISFEVPKDGMRKA